MKKKADRKKSRKKGKAGIIIFLLLLAIIAINVWQNMSIGITKYKIYSDKIGDGLDGTGIVQLTDIHSIRSQEQADTIVKNVKCCAPYIIVITGDLVDARYYSSDLNTIQSDIIPNSETVEMVRRLTEIAPVYFVYGNHEMVLLDDPQNNPFKRALEDMGVNILNNRAIILERNGDSINLLGIQDPSTLYKDPYFAYVEGSKTEAMLEYVTADIDESLFTVLLSHRPECFETYGKYPLDLVITGHAHGGQFRIPFIGGVYAPNQGFCPKYTSGIHVNESTGMQMEIGRGIGNSTIPVRIFNQPEIVEIVLLKKQ